MATNLVTPLSLRPAEAAKALGISTRTLWGLTSPRGPIPCVRVGHGRRQAVLYPVAELRAWLSRQAAAENSRGTDDPAAATVEDRVGAIVSDAERRGLPLRTASSMLQPESEKGGGYENSR